jgi:adenosine kinase
MKILVSGSLAYDRIMDFKGLFGDHILPERTHQVNISFYIDSLSESFGGSAGNIAYALSLLGEHALILATAGNDFEFYRSWLDDHKVDTSHVRIDEGEKTAFATIITDRNNNQITAFYAGAMQSPAHIPESLFSEKVFGIVAPGNLADMRTLPPKYRHNNIPFIFDPGQNIPVLSADDLKNGIQGSAAFITNDYEFAMVEKKTGWSETDILKHTGILVTTFGEKGSRIRTEEQDILVPAAQAETVKDPTGAGDAYRAGFVHGLLKGWPLETCGKFAGLIGCYAVEVRGTQAHSFTKAELRKRYKENFNEELPEDPL